MATPVPMAGRMPVASSAGKTAESKLAASREELHAALDVYDRTARDTPESGAAWQKVIRALYPEA